MSQQKRTSMISIRFLGSARVRIDFSDRLSITRINAQEPAPGKKIEVISDDGYFEVHIMRMQREDTHLFIGCVPVI